LLPIFPSTCRSFVAHPSNIQLLAPFRHWGLQAAYEDKHSGFIVLAIDSLLAETIQQFMDGVTEGEGRCKEMITRFLAGSRFQPEFNHEARIRFFKDIRCGLLHQAEAKKMWLIRRKQAALLQPFANGKGYIIDVERFHAGLKGTLNDYLKLVSEPNSVSIRSKLWHKMHQICNVRAARGLYESGDDSARTRLTPRKQLAGDGGAQN
jgi:hypothetical protein